jgi:hypothetical protein
MRFIQKIDSEKLQVLKKRQDWYNDLGAWTCIQVEDALSKRFWLDEIWRVALRQYEGIPDTANRSRPYSESMVIEIPIGAKQCDTIVSAVRELIFGTSPVFTVRGSAGYEDHAFAFQMLTDKLVLDKFTNFRMAADELITDTIQMGTGVGCVVRNEEIVKHATFETIDRGPRCSTIPPEDFIVPGGAYTDLDAMQLTGYRLYYNEAELREAAKANGWDVTGFKPAGNVSWVRQRREHVAKTDESTENIGRLYELFFLYAYYDYDHDGFAEDLYYVYDRTSKRVGFVSYAPYDTRPLVISRYQLRPHVFYGLGVLEMARPFETEVSEWHNFKLANAHLSNSRMWAYRLGAAGLGEELDIGPNKSIGLTDPKNDLVALTMSDVYQSAMQYEMQTLMLADQRVGVNELGGGPITSGKRVPAATAMSIMQQQNRRFATPFNNMREACADMMAQCILRLREQYLKGDDYRRDAMEFIAKAVGAKYANLIEEVFAGSSNDLRDYVTIEVTASSASVNRESDRQSAMQLVTVLSQYYDKLMQMYMMLVNPQVPPEMKQMMMQIMKSSSLAVERLLRTFDNVRDPKQYLPEIGGQQNDQTSGNAAGGAGGPQGTGAGAGGPPQFDQGTTNANPDVGASTEVPGGLLGDTSALG